MAAAAALAASWSAAAAAGRSLLLLRPAGRLQLPLAGRLQRPQPQPPGWRVLLLDDVTCDSALCEASAAGGGCGGLCWAGEPVEEMRAIESHGGNVGDGGV